MSCTNIGINKEDADAAVENITSNAGDAKNIGLQIGAKYNEFIGGLNESKQLLDAQEQLSTEVKKRLSDQSMYEDDRLKVMDILCSYINNPKNGVLCEDKLQTALKDSVKRKLDKDLLKKFTFLSKAQLSEVNEKDKLKDEIELNRLRLENDTLKKNLDSMRGGALDQASAQESAPTAPTLPPVLGGKKRNTKRNRSKKGKRTRKQRFMKKMMGGGTKVKYTIEEVLKLPIKKLLEKLAESDDPDGEYNTKIKVKLPMIYKRAVDLLDWDAILNDLINASNSAFDKLREDTEFMLKEQDKLMFDKDIPKVATGLLSSARTVGLLVAREKLVSEQLDTFFVESKDTTKYDDKKKKDVINKLIGIFEGSANTLTDGYNRPVPTNLKGLLTDKGELLPKYLSGGNATSANATSANAISADATGADAISADGIDLSLNAEE